MYEAAEFRWALTYANVVRWRNDWPAEWSQIKVGVNDACDGLSPRLLERHHASNFELRT